MSQQHLDLKELLAIDGGIRYIIHRYPDASESENNRKRKFKVRPEKTASAALKRMEDGTYIVTDFGNDSKGRNAVQVCMLEDNVDFITALRTVAGFYGYAGQKPVEPRAEYNAWPARPDENEGLMTFAYRDFEIHDLRWIFSENAWKALGHDDDERRKQAIAKCTYYHLKCLQSYTYTKDGRTQEFGSNEQFPIFLWDEGDWKKLYKPRAEKKHRFHSYGKKPEHFIHGLSQAQKKYAELQASADADSFDDNGNVMKQKREKKLNEVVLCTGGSDALNVAALGYQVIWLNSETAELQPADYKAFAKLADKVYNLPDIDTTGKRAAHELAMQFLDLRTIFLPESLRSRQDIRGNPCKDVRDYLRFHRKYEFDELMRVALPYQFWDEELAMDKKTGEVLLKFGKPLYRFVFNNVHAYNFLFKNGFARFQSPKEKEGYIYVRVEGNIVRQIQANEVKNFIHGFLENRMMATDLRNTMYRSPQLSENSLSNLGVFEGDFKAYGPDFQYLFFKKCAWRVTAEGITEEKPGSIDKYIWDHKVIEHKVSVLPDMFRVTKLEPTEIGAAPLWDIDVLNNDCMFFRFLIQTCRTHWRTELEYRLNIWQLSKKERDEYQEKHLMSDEDMATLMAYQHKDAQDAYREKFRFSIDGDLLTDEERAEQKQHLVNRLFSIGYALHRYKNPARPWAVFAMDAKLSEEGESHGGAGKGLVAKALYKLAKKVQLDGRNPKLTENPHVFENVDADTDLIHIEDANEYLNFGFFFAPLTSAMTINPKQKRSFELGFEDSPKFWFDTNFGDRMTDPSSLRRKLYTVFGDYYHENSGDYRETRTPNDDFGRSLFTDFDETDWNRFYNFMAQCLKFYLCCEDKIMPPMGNVSKRNLMSAMGDHFRDWADVYFAPESGRIDMLIPKEEAMEDLIRFTKLKTFTAQRFTKSLKAWAKFNGYELNPTELLNSQGRIVRKVDGHSKEMVYVRTPDREINEVRI